MSDSAKNGDEVPDLAKTAPGAALQAPVVAQPAGHRNFFVRAWRKEVPAWRIFWFMAAPWLLLGFLPLWVITFIAGALIIFLPWPVALALGMLVLALLVGGAMLLWRCAFNVQRRPLGYLARTCAVLLLLAPVAGGAYLYQSLMEIESSQARADKVEGRELFVAAHRGDVEEVRSLVNAGADVRARDTERPNEGRTALHWAAGGGHYNNKGKHVEVVRLLLAKGADVNAGAEGGYTPLHVAAGLGQVDITRLLLDNGADINAKDRRGTPLEAAVLQGHENVVALLLERKPPLDGVFRVYTMLGTYYPQHTSILRRLVEAGADVNEVEPGGAVPIDHLIYRGEEPILFLLSRGADVGKGPLDAGARVGRIVFAGHEKALEHIFKNGYDLRRRGPGGESLMHYGVSSSERMLEFIHRQGVSPDERDSKGDQPIHYAARLGATASLKWLLKMKVPVDAEGANGTTPLMQIGVTKEIEDEITKVLLASGASLTKRDHNGYAALDHAATRSDWSVRLFLKHGAAVDAVNKDGKTALHHATRHDAVEALAAAGANVNMRSKNGRTPLHEAAAGAGDSVKVLLEKGADPAVADADGATPLHIAARHSSWSVEMLINAGAAVMARDKAGKTPMHFAALQLSDSAQKLLKAGADINATDRLGNTPLHEAARAHNSHSIKHLIGLGANPEAKNREGMTPVQLVALAAQADFRKATDSAVSAK